MTPAVTIQGEAQRTASVRQWADRLRATELAQHADRWEGLTESDRAHLDELTRRIVRALLNSPALGAAQLYAGGVRQVVD